MRLRDTERYSWHRLTSHPDKIVNSEGNTSFLVSWSLDPVHNLPAVYTKDDHGCPSWRVSGNERTQKYLDTEVVEE